MSYALEAQHRRRREEIRAFYAAEAAPWADAWDNAGAVPEEIIQKMAAAGHFGAAVPPEYGGLGWDQLSLAILSEECGYVDSSLRSLLTVHQHLFTESLLKWGSAAQKAHWLPLLAAGKKFAAFGLSEPMIGSDARNIQTTWRREGERYVLNGVKKWITFAQRADVFMIIARQDQAVTAFLVERDTPGLTVVPQHGIAGTRSSRIGEIHLENVEVPAAQVVGKPGFGFLAVVNTALDAGRLSVASGTLGLLRACVHLSAHRARTREQFGVLLREHQLIRQKVAQMATDAQAARQLCYAAAAARQRNHPESLRLTNVAKYFTTTAASRAAADTVQIHGAEGLQAHHPAQRFYRDVRVFEIIEGSTQMQELLIGDWAITDPESLLSIAED